ncbi:hypothetical protein CDAR_117981 [Caerostris darwini]|uniref:Uncharacterized protein n=1 Tax=Caerostris darwini TaxID=1538125 RepID=A0AAV4PX84_9ARAC|nr:hypothetical protein CDAR_117981 [Caerostris darwini]
MSGSQLHSCTPLLLQCWPHLPLTSKQLISFLYQISLQKNPSLRIVFCRTLADHSTFFLPFNDRDLFKAASAQSSFQQKSFPSRTRSFIERLLTNCFKYKETAGISKQTPVCGC